MIFFLTFLNAVRYSFYFKIIIFKTLCFLCKTKKHRKEKFFNFPAVVFHLYFIPTIKIINKTKKKFNAASTLTIILKYTNHQWWFGHINIFEVESFYFPLKIKQKIKMIKQVFIQI